MGLGVGINSLGLKNPTSPFLLPSVPRAAIMQPNASGSQHPPELLAMSLCEAMAATRQVGSLSLTRMGPSPQGPL